jgi:tRNA(Ile)-lysidine synthase
MDFESKVQHDILDRKLFRPGDKLLAAVSGGADSVAMLHILCSLRNSLGISIVCGHINHRLRDKDSDQDQRFTAELCSGWNVPFFAEQIDVKACAAREKLSIETAGRQLRLEALEQIARQAGCDSVATAHHQDDQAETVLFRLLRGTAFAGLAGIRPITERSGLRWIRPLLCVRRKEIESYCRQHTLAWRDDASNQELHFRRNWIRHRLLPYMQQSSGDDVAEKLSTLAQTALSFQQQVEKRANEILKENGDWYVSPSSLSAATVQQAGPFVAGEILRITLNRLNCGLRDISASHYQRFFQLMNKSRAVLELPGGCTIRKKNDRIQFETADSLPDTKTILPVEIPAEGIIQFAGWKIQTRIISITQKNLESFRKQRDNFRQWFDWKQIQFPVIARSRQPNDRFVPLGHKTQKKISRFLTDSQVDSGLRNTCFVIEDKAGILWLSPVRRSCRAAVCPDTIWVLEIRTDKL